MATQIHSALVWRSRPHRLIERAYREILSQLGEKFLCTEAVQIFHYTVIIEDGHLMLGEDHRQEIAMRAIAFAGSGDASGCGRTVMSVGNIDGGQGLESESELVDGGIVGNRPKLMAHAVVNGNINVGSAGCYLGQNGVDRRRVRITA